ncbi:MAG: fibronectin type III domain-containing protein [Flavobacteriales bacterium]|nr:fibronectin type III domain-containing protein [Flavobacteriales bacterium]
MEKFTVKLGTAELSSTGLVEKGRTVHNSILGNVGYPTLQPMLPVLASACDALDEANQAMLFTGGKVASTNKQAAEADLRSVLKDFAGYVQGISEGDKKLIQSAAFDVVKERAPMPAPQAPAELRVTRSATAGMLKTRWKKVRGAVLYYLEMKVTKDGEFTRIATTTRTTHQLNDLETGVEYYFRVQAIASSGISPMSEVAAQKAA